MDVDLYRYGPTGNEGILSCILPPNSSYFFTSGTASILESGDICFCKGLLLCNVSPGSSLCSTHLLVEGKNNSMHWKKIMTASILIAGISVLLTLSPGWAVHTETKLAGFQMDPTINGGQDPGIVEWVRFDKENIFAPYGTFSMLPEYGDNNISIAMAGLGAGAVAHSGLVGSLCMNISTPGDYILSGHKILCGDTSAHELPNPVGCSGKLLLVQDCSEPEPPNNDTNDTNGGGGGGELDPINFRWEPLDPTTVCAGEEFCVDLYIDIPVGVEYRGICFFPVCRDDTVYRVSQSPEYNIFCCGVIPTSSLGGM